MNNKNKTLSNDPQTEEFSKKYFYTISEAAALLGVSDKTLRNWEEQGKIFPKRTKGGSRRYHLAQLKKIITQNPKLTGKKTKACLKKISATVVAQPTLMETVEANSQKTEEIIRQEQQLEKERPIVYLPQDFPQTPALHIKRYHQETQLKKIYLSQLYQILAITVFIITLVTTLITSSLMLLHQTTPALTIPALISPFNSLALKILPAVSPGYLAQTDQTPGVEKFLTPGVNKGKAAVLAEETVTKYLEINSNTFLNGDLVVSRSVNGIEMTATTSGMIFADILSGSSLEVSGDVTLNQNLSTTSSPTFSSLNLSSLSLSSTSNQLVLGTGTTGTLTWAPTSSSKTLTLPDITDTLVSKTTTDTLSNKTIKSGDSNTISGSFSGITGLGTISTGTWNGTKIGTGYGGTGLTSYTKGDILYTSATDTLEKLNVGTSGQVLTVSSGIPGWANASGGVTSVNSLTGALTIAGAGINSISASGTTVTITGTEADTLAAVTARGATTSAAVTFSSTINSNTFSSTALTFAGATPAISASTAGTNINLDAGTSGKVVIAGSSTGDVDMAGGSSSTGCTVTNSSGTLTCAGDIIGGSTGTSGYWTRAGTSLSPSTAGDSITTSGGISTTGSGTLQIAGAVTFSSTVNSNTLTSTALTFAGTTPVISASTAATSLTVNPGAGGSLNLAGGSGSTGCTVDDTTGNFTCSGSITSGGGGDVGFWKRNSGTSTLSPVTTGDHISTSGNITSEGTGTITSGGLLTGQTGLTVTGGTISLNASSNYDTNINTGNSSGAISIGNSAAGAITLQSNAASVFHPPANTATAFRFTDGTNAYQTIDTRSTLSGVSAFTFAAGTAPTITSATNAEYTTATFTPPTITLTGVTQVTSGMDSILFNAPTITDSSAITVDQANTLTIAGAPIPAGSATITSASTLRIAAGAVAAGATNAYGLFVDAPTGGGSNYAAVFNTGNVGIGIATPAYKLDVATSTVSDRGINIANTAATGTNYGIYSSVTGAATTNYGGYFVSTGATTDYGLAVAALTGATSTGLDIGALSGTTADKGINIGAISGTGATGAGLTIGNISTTGTTNYGINLGTMTGGTTSNYQISTGTLTSATTTTNAQLNLGGVVTTGGTTNYGINIGALSGTGTTNYGVNVAALTSTGTTNYGLYLGGDSGAATTNYGLYLGTVSGATTNYGALLAGTWFTGGTATTTKPQLLVEPSGTTSTGWSTSGTGLGINSAQTFAGNLLDLQQAGLSTFKVAGVSTAVNGFTFTTAATGSPSTVSMAASGSDTNITLGIDSKGTGALNLGTGANAKTITIGNNTTSTALALTSGTGSQTFTSSVVSGTTTTSGFVFTDNTTLTGTEAYIGSTGVTSGTLLNIGTGAANTFSSGKLLSLTTTSTGLTSGSLASFDWSPTGTTNIYATGDLVSISTGNAYAFVGNLLNIKSQGSSVFSVSDTTMTSALPANFTSAGDVAVAYDLNFTNPTASFIKSSAPLYLQAGETFNSSDLILRTFNQGSIVLDSAITTGTGVDMSNTTLTTGTGVNITSTTLTSGKLLNIGPTFAGAAVTGYGEYINGADSTTAANTDYQLYSTLALTGNAAKTGIGLYSTVTSSSTTGDTLIGLDLATSATGALAATQTRTVYGLRSQPASTAVTANADDTLNLYGSYLAPSSTLATAGTTNVYGEYITTTASHNADAGTVNQYGLYIANGTSSTNGTSLKTMLYVASPTGADTNYAAVFAGGNVGIGDTSPAALLSVGSGDLFQVNTNGSITQAQSAVSGGQIALSLTPGAHTTMTAEASDIAVLAHTDTITAGFTNQRFNRFMQPTISAASSLTVTNAATLYVENAPAVAASAVITNPYALWVDAGASRFDGAVGFGAQQTFTDSDATPDVSAGTHFITNTTTFTITDFDAGSGTLSAGHIIFVESNGAITYDCTPFVNLNCGAADIVTAAKDLTVWIYDGTDWTLVNWMKNSGTQTGLDLAEVYVSTENLEAGDVVSIDQDQKARVKKSRSAYEKQTIGVVSTQPGIILQDGPAQESSYPIALAGQVPVKVSTESGEIKAGDYLTSSSLPGIAMKATKPGPVIGKALEDFPANSANTSDGVKQGKILVFINTSFADPLDLLANLTLDSKGNLVTSSSVILEGAQRPIGSDSIASPSASLQNDVLNLQSQVASLSARLTQLEVSSSSWRESSTDRISNTDSIASPASGVASPSASLQNDVLGLTSPDLLLATDSAHLGEFSEATISGLLTSYEGIFQNSLKSLGETYLGNTTIAGNLSVDGTMSITGSSLSTLSTLYLQNGPLTELVDFFNGAITMNQQGQVKAKSISVDEIKVSNKSAGTGIIKAGQTKVIIYNTLIQPNSIILLTPETPLTQTMAVTSKTPTSSFTVKIAYPESMDITFNYLIVGISSGSEL